MDIVRITNIYNEIDGFGIELEADPTVLGPQYLGKVIAQCRNFLNRTTSILLEIRRDKHMTSNRLSAEKAAFKIESDNLLASDERVRSRPNIRDREAMINVILSERLNRITELENDIRNLEAVEGAVKVRHTELVRTDGQIKTQRSLIRDELDTKSFFGDESNTRRAADVNEDELDAIMSGTYTPPTAPAEPSTAIFTTPEPTATEAVDSVTITATPAVEVPEAAAPVPEAPKVETAPPVSDIDAALAAAEEAVESVKEPEPVKAGAPSEDEEAMNRFLNAESAAEKALESKPAAKGRKSTTKKKEAEEPPPVMATSGDPDFDDILANL